MKKNIYTEYKSTLDFLYTQLPVYQRVGRQAYKIDLNNIIELCKHFGNPFQEYPCIHIAGTNGKGSTAHLLSSVLQAHGYKVGLYTSPHYKDFRERIKISGKYISRKYVVEFVKENKSIFQKIKPSFFEITVALAFKYFADEKIDIGVIETGLGGRLDSTNIISPILSIITNISFDHQQFLGNTLESIAGEKAGIIKQGIPVVIGETQKVPSKVFKAVAKTNDSKIYFADKNYQVELKKENLTHSWFNVSRKKSKDNWFVNPTTFKVNLHGAYQAKNITTVLQSLEVLQKHFPLKESKIKAAFSNLKKETNFKGRWQLLSEQPAVICDSAHNEGGLKLAMQQIENAKFNQLHCVLGMVNDKSIEKMLKFFPSDANFYFCRPNIPRGLSVDKLKAKADEIGLKGKSYSSVKNALKAAKRKATSKDLIYVGGSTFVVAEVIT